MVELFGAVLLLFGLSDLLFRFLGLGAYAHGSRREPKVALTFDDGPSERTEALLALLARHGVKATFFLTGEKARARPDLVEAIKRAGHQVEDHGEWHRPLWLFLPGWSGGTWPKTPGATTAPSRPPHPLHPPLRPALGKRVVLWDLESKDWLNLPPRSSPNGFSSTCAPGPSSSSTTGRSAP